jgi:hypothetical protein
MMTARYMIRLRDNGFFSTGKTLVLPAMLLLLAATGCHSKGPDLTEAPDIPMISAVSPDSGEIVVGAPVVYEVVVKETGNMTDWEKEMISGYDGTELIEHLLEGVFTGDIPAYDYFTGALMNEINLQKLREDPEFSAETIGQLQFTEYWTFNPCRNTFRKRVQQIVLGYEDRDDAGNLLGYKAAFVIPFDISGQ